MATVNEILHQVKERDSSFNITDDYKVDDELIIAMMNNTRSTLLRELYNDKGYISAEFYQMNCCYEIECVEGFCEYNGVEIGDGEFGYQVKLKPHVTGLNGLEIRHIGNRLGSLKFTKMSFDSFNSLESRKWTPKTKAATIVGDLMFLKNIPTAGMKFVCLLELLEDPRTACDWRNDESTYPVPSAQKLIDMVLYRLMTSGRVPDDKLQNAAADTADPRISDEAIGMQQRLQTEQSRPQATSNQQRQE